MRFGEEQEYTPMACPYCDWKGARSVRDEITHMEANHNDIIEERLRRANLVPPADD